MIFNAGVASIVSNMTGSACVHPIDTVRVRVQLEKRKMTASKCFQQTMKFEGIKGLYKGLTQPLLGAVPIKAIGFTVNEVAKKELARAYPYLSTS
jgi:solute carrier family 25 phosphate transporter 23/24/25/41